MLTSGHCRAAYPSPKTISHFVVNICCLAGLIICRRAITKLSEVVGFRPKLRLVK